MIIVGYYGITLVVLSFVSPSICCMSVSPSIILFPDGNFRSETFFRGDLLMKYFLQEGQLSVSSKSVCTRLVNCLED